MMNWVNIELLAFVLFSALLLIVKARYKTEMGKAGEASDGNL
jgi:hypothetical protein